MCSNKTQSKRMPIIIGVAVALTVFAIGFGVMLIMYNYWLNNHTDNYTELKGLFDYKASLWGDALCLPLMIGAGITYILVFYKKVKYKMRLLFPILVSVVGGATGFIMQMQWVISDNTLLNWSIPEQHHFNYAGWYHAVFFVIICSSIAFIVACLIQIDTNLLKNIDLNNQYEMNTYSFCHFFIWFSGIWFLQLHCLDDYSEIFPQWCIIVFWTVVGLVFLCGFRLVFLRSKRDPKYFTPVIFAIIISTILSFVIISVPVENDVSFLISSIIFSVLYIYNSKNKAKMFFFAMSFGSLTWLFQLNISYQLKDGKIIFATFLALCCVLIPAIVSFWDVCFIEKCSSYYLFMHLLIISAALVISFLLVFLANIDGLSVMINGLDSVEHYKYEVGTFLIGSMIPLYVRYTFNRIKQIEEERQEPELIDKYKMSQYIIYFLLYASALILLINCLYFNFSIELERWEIFLIVVTTVLVILLCLMMRLTNNENISILLLILCYSTVFLCLIATGIQNTSLVFSRFGTVFGSFTFWIIITIIVIDSCTLSIFMTISVLNNVALIRQKPMSRQVSVSAIIIGIFSGLCYGIAAYQLLIIQTIFYMIQLLVVTMIAFAIVPYLQASILNPDGNVGILDNYARSGVMQDGFLYSAVVTVNPIVTIGLINNIAAGHWFSAVLTYFAYSIVLSPLWSYCISNNVYHCQKKKELCDEIINKKITYSAKKNLEDQYNSLKTYLTIQNIIAIILSMPYTIIFLMMTIYENSEKDDCSLGLLPK